jgi:hypothetical protein
MNATSGKLKDKKTRCNHRKLFSFIARSCENFRSSRDHKNMSAESAIKKLHTITKGKET